MSAARSYRGRAYSGLVVTDHSRVFISRGIGWAIAPVRFNCPPEIALLELQPATALATER